MFDRSSHSNSSCAYTGKFGLVSHGLMSSQKRALLLIAKALQQIGNGIKFDESNYMSCLNSLVDSHHKPLVEYLSEIESSPAPQLDEERDPTVSSMALQNILLRIPIYAPDLQKELRFESNEENDLGQFENKQSCQLFRFLQRWTFFSNERETSETSGMSY